MDFQWSRNGPMFQEPRWISCYSNQHLILLVGEGNFSFAASLGNAFGAATNMVATSLDSKDELLKKYGMTAEWNTLSLMHRGALVFHGFDACKMAIQLKNLLGGLRLSLFHCIIFNFPHAGFLGKENDAHVLKKHRELVRDFFANAKGMLLPGGQVHVRHKLGHPYDEWKLEELALSSGLKLLGRVPFCLHQFPGYQNCRGDGFRADESFKLGPADTYIFAVKDEEPPAKTSQIKLVKILAPGSKFLRGKAPAKNSAPEPLKPLVGEAELKALSSQVRSWQQNIANDEARVGKQKEKKVDKAKQVDKEKNLKKKVKKQKKVQKAEQVEKQKLVEKKKMEKQNQVEMEKQYQVEVEKQKQVEMEKQKQVEIEKQKQVEIEKQKQVEVEKQMKLALEMATKMKLDKEEVKTLETRTSASMMTSVSNSGSVIAKKPQLISRPSPQVTKKTISALHNGVEDLGLSDPMLVRLKCLKGEMIRQGRGALETPLYHVAADEVVRLEKIKKQLGEKKLRTLRMLKLALQNYKLPPDCHAAKASLPTPGENQIPLSREEGNAPIIETSTSSPTQVKVSCSKNVPIWQEKTIILDTTISALARDSSEAISENCPGLKQNSQSPEIHLTAPTDLVSCELNGLSKTSKLHLQSLMGKAIRKARASENTTFEQVAADEVARLENVKSKLGTKKMKTLENLKSALRVMNLSDCQIVEEQGSVPEEKIEPSNAAEDAIALISQNTKDHQLHPNEVGEEFHGECEVWVQDEVVDPNKVYECCGESEVRVQDEVVDPNEVSEECHNVSEVRVRDEVVDAPEKKRKKTRRRKNLS